MTVTNRTAAVALSGDPEQSIAHLRPNIPSEGIHPSLESHGRCDQMSKKHGSNITPSEGTTVLSSTHKIGRKILIDPIVVKWSVKYDGTSPCRNECQVGKFLVDYILFYSGVAWHECFLWAFNPVMIYQRNRIGTLSQFNCPVQSQLLSDTCLVHTSFFLQFSPFLFSGKAG